MTGDRIDRWRQTPVKLVELLVSVLQFTQSAFVGNSNRTADELIVRDQPIILQYVQDEIEPAKHPMLINRTLSVEIPNETFRTKSEGFHLELTYQSFFSSAVQESVGAGIRSNSAQSSCDFHRLRAESQLLLLYFCMNPWRYIQSYNYTSIIYGRYLSLSNKSIQNQGRP